MSLILHHLSLLFSNAVKINLGEAKDAITASEDEAKNQTA